MEELNEHSNGTVVANPLITTLDWTDLVLPAPILHQIETIRDQIIRANNPHTKFEFDRRLKPGLRYLFRGPAGTGKTLTAALIGKTTEREVCGIDLSGLISKWIGETEKNLDVLFEHATSCTCILFFDEADALFGRRTDIKPARDRHANLVTNYLLQRVESCAGVVILTSNTSNNIDRAFLRRLDAVVDFPTPDAAARLRLWRAAIPDAIRLEPNIDLSHLAEKHPVTGGVIIRATQYACLRSMAKARAIGLSDFEEGISRELQKSNAKTSKNLR